MPIPEPFLSKQGHHSPKASKSNWWRFKKNQNSANSIILINVLLLEMQGYIHPP
jgi:hypothetical protein